MKLFFRDHLSIIILYSISFLLLPWIIHVLDDLSSHYAYFIFLVSFLFILWSLVVIIEEESFIIIYKKYQHTG